MAVAAATTIQCIQYTQRNILPWLQLVRLIRAAVQTRAAAAARHGNLGPVSAAAVSLSLFVRNLSATSSSSSSTPFTASYSPPLAVPPSLPSVHQPTSPLVLIAMPIAEPGPAPTTAGSSAVVDVDQSLRRTDHRLAASRPREQSPTAPRTPVTGERQQQRRRRRRRRLSEQLRTSFRFAQPFRTLFKRSSNVTVTVTAGTRTPPAITITRRTPSAITLAMHRLLPNDFHVVERSQEEQQPQQEAFDGEQGGTGQYQEQMAQQGQGEMINREQRIQNRQQRRWGPRQPRGISRRTLPSSHLTQYALRNCCRVFDAMEKSLGSNELLMDSVLHYMHYK